MKICSRPAIRSRPARGFTLLEMMIAVGLLAMAAAISMPAINRALNPEGLRKAVEDMLEACSHARAMAILHGHPTEFVLQAEDGQISVRQVRPRGGAEGEGRHFKFSRRLPDDVSPNFMYVNFQDMMTGHAEIRVRFFPNGTSEEFTVILTAPEGERMITLDVVTGLARMEVIR
jgi:prepilin-type N-terminal cleavage/methylation domain-containing protein